MLFLEVTKKCTLTTGNKKDGLLRQPIACYKIDKRTYNFVMTYVGNRTINMEVINIPP